MESQCDCIVIPLFDRLRPKNELTLRGSKRYKKAGGRSRPPVLKVRSGFGLAVNEAISASGERRSPTCAVIRRRFPAGASPARRPLQPEATGAGMEATKCLKPPDSGHEVGDCASVQAATRVNAEQTSKRSMCRPTRKWNRGRLTRMGDFTSDECAHLLHRGSGGSMYTRKAHATRETPTRDQG